MVVAMGLYFYESAISHVGRLQCRVDGWFCSDLLEEHLRRCAAVLVVHSAAAARVDACLAVAISSFLSAAALCRCSLLLLALSLDYRTNHARGCNVVPIAVCTDANTFEMVVLKDATLPQALSAVTFALRLFVQNTAWR